MQWRPCPRCTGKGRSARLLCSLCGSAGVVGPTLCPFCGSADLRETDPPEYVHNGMVMFGDAGLACNHCGVAMSKEAAAYSMHGWRASRWVHYVNDE
jgi:hypothetical protein